MKNEPGTLKNHKNRPGTMKNHENRPGQGRNKQKRYRHTNRTFLLYIDHRDHHYHRDHLHYHHHRDAWVWLSVPLGDLLKAVENVAWDIDISLDKEIMCDNGLSVIKRYWYDQLVSCQLLLKTMDYYKKTWQGVGHILRKLELLLLVEKPANIRKSWSWLKSL